MRSAFNLEPVAFKYPGDHRLRVVLFKRLFRVGVQVANDVVEVRADFFHPRLRVLPGLQVLRASGAKVKVRLRLRESILDNFIHALQERAGGGSRSGGWVESSHWC